ncbi:MAG: tyrosine-type recombinase/integrase [Elusimicrobiota bacterium]
MPKIHEYLQPYLKYLDHVKGLSEGTILCEKKVILLFLRWLDEFKDKDITEVETIDTPLILSHLKEKAFVRNKRALQSYLGILRRFFEYLKIFGFKTENPLAKVIPARVSSWHRLRIPLTYEEIKKVFQEVRKPTRIKSDRIRNLAIINMLYFYGLRSKELRNLKIGDVDFINKAIKIDAKGNTERLLPLTENIAGLLTDYLNIRSKSSSDYFFVTLTGRKMDDNFLAKTVGKYGQRIGLKKRLSPYVFRCTCATHMLESGKFNIVEIQKWLGHQTVDSTRRYVHISGWLIREALNRHPINKMTFFK